MDMPCSLTFALSVLHGPFARGGRPVSVSERAPWGDGGDLHAASLSSQVSISAAMEASVVVAAFAKVVRMPSIASAAAVWIDASVPLCIPGRGRGG